MCEKNTFFSTTYAFVERKKCLFILKESVFIVKVSKWVCLHLCCSTLCACECGMGRWWPALIG